MTNDFDLSQLSKPIEDPYVIEVLNKIMALQDRSSEECPHCGQQITHMLQNGRCVYAVPCGHRLWQGFVPTAWQTHSLDVSTLYAGNETRSNTHWPVARSRSLLKLLRRFLARVGQLITKDRNRTV